MSDLSKGMAKSEPSLTEIYDDFVVQWSYVLLDWANSFDVERFSSYSDLIAELENERARHLERWFAIYNVHEKIDFTSPEITHRINQVAGMRRYDVPTAQMVVLVYVMRLAQDLSNSLIHYFNGLSVGASLSEGHKEEILRTIRLNIDKQLRRERSPNTIYPDHMVDQWRRLRKIQVKGRNGKLRKLTERESIDRLKGSKKFAAFFTGKEDANVVRALNQRVRNLSNGNA